MKSRRFISSLITPLSKLKYPQKFVLISLLFILPLAVVIYLLVVELNTRIDHFGWREKYGTEYLRSLRELMEDVQQHRNITYESISKEDTAPNNELLTLQSQIDRDFEALELLDQQYGAVLGTTERVKVLRAKWKELETTAFNQDLEESYKLHTEFIANIHSLMFLIGDTSNLVLDPELDSYYLIDAVLLKLPEAQELLAQLLILSKDAVKYRVLTVDEKVQLVVLTGLIKSNLETMNSNVHTAMANNPAQDLKPRIGDPLQEDVITARQFLKLIDDKIINVATINIDAAEFDALGNKTLQASFNFYDAASPALENLIQARIDNLSRRRYFLIAFALGSTIVAFLIGLSMMRTISRPLSDLAKAAKRLGLGDLSTRVMVASADEIGEVGSAFNNMVEELQASQKRVADRNRRLEIVASLGEHLSAILDLEVLLAEVVNQVKDNFGYYHAHIYLLDDKREKLIVVEGTGAAGAEMKARGHSIPLDAPTSLLARAARTGELVQVDNVHEAADWLPNPLLPNTHAEMAVPIILEEQVVGVLDVQQDKIAGLDENDANLLRSLANQVAIAIRNARQFAEVEAALIEARQLQQQYIEQSWDRTRVTRKSTGRVQFSLGESTTLSETIIAEMRQQALTHREPAIATFNGSAEEPAVSSHGHTSSALVAPIVLHNVPVGDVQLYEDDPNRKWTEGELALIRAVADQVAQAAEHLRLLDETQERASRGQLVSQISNKIRRAPDMESLMQVAVAELSRVLGPARTFVHMGLKAELGQGQAAEVKETEPVEPAPR